MKARQYGGLSSRQLSRLELRNFARIGEVYRTGFAAQAVSDRIDDLLDGMPRSDYWMFRALLVGATLMPSGMFRWIARCENESTGPARYRLSAPLHFPLKTLAVILFHGQTVEQQIAESRSNPGVDVPNLLDRRL